MLRGTARLYCGALLQVRLSTGMSRLFEFAATDRPLIRTSVAGTRAIARVTIASWLPAAARPAAVPAALRTTLTRPIGVVVTAIAVVVVAPGVVSAIMMTVAVAAIAVTVIIPAAGAVTTTMIVTVVIVAAVAVTVAISIADDGRIIGIAIAGVGAPARPANRNGDASPAAYVRAGSSPVGDGPAVG